MLALRRTTSYRLLPKQLVDSWRTPTFLFCCLLHTTSLLKDLSPPMLTISSASLFPSLQFHPFSTWPVNSLYNKDFASQHLSGSIWATGANKPSTYSMVMPIHCMDTPIASTFLISVTLASLSRSDLLCFLQNRPTASRRAACQPQDPRRGSSGRTGLYPGIAKRMELAAQLRSFVLHHCTFETIDSS